MDAAGREPRTLYFYGVWDRPKPIVTACTAPLGVIESTAVEADNAPYLAAGNRHHEGLRD